LSLALVASLSLVTQARAAVTKPRLVQKKLLQVTTGNGASVTFGRPNKVGDLIVAYVVWDNTAAVTLSDTRGNTYASAVGPTQSGDLSSAQVFYASNVAAGTNTVTATFAGAITARAVLYVQEYSGVDPISPLAAAVGSSGTSASMD